jgi:CHASE2 domain-containing sensor protein
MGLTDNNRDNTDNLTPPGTNTLEEIFRTSDKIIGVGKFTGVPGDGFFTPIAPPPILAQKQQVADISTIVDADGVVRRGTLYPISDGSPESKIPSLALKLAYRYLSESGITPEATPRGWLGLGDAVFPPLEENQGGYVNTDDRGYQILLDWREFPEAGFDRVSLMDVLRGRVSGQRFQDKVVLIGAYAPSLRDRFYTPFSHYQGTTPKPMYGVEIQALLTSQIIQAALLEAGGIRGVAQPWEYGWIWLWVSLEYGFLRRWRRGRYPGLTLMMALIGGMGLSGVLVGVTYAAFLLDIWIPSGAALVGIGLMGVWGVLYFYIQELQEYNGLLVAQVNQKTQHLEEALIQLQTTQNQLIQQEKLTAMSSLVGNLSHELKNPLWALGNRLEILTMLTQQWREGKGEEVVLKWEEQVEKAKQELNRANGLVATLLPVPQGELPQSLARATVGMIVELAVKLACPQDEGIEIEWRLGAWDGVPVKVPLLVLRVLTNLLDNAVYAVRCKREGLEESDSSPASSYIPQIRIEWVEENESVIWRVWDNGIGISESMQKRLFEPLVTTKPMGEGSGLGLYIVYELVQKHQGAIGVKSQVGEYTEFEIVFPKSQLVFEGERE